MLLPVQGTMAVGKKPAAAPLKGKKKPATFVIDCAKPVEDKIMKIGEFEKFLVDKIKVDNKVGELPAPMEQPGMSAACCDCFQYPKSALCHHLWRPCLPLPDTIRRSLCTLMRKQCAALNVDEHPECSGGLASDMGLLRWQVCLETMWWSRRTRQR